LTLLFEYQVRHQACENASVVQKDTHLGSGLTLNISGKETIERKTKCDI